MAQQEFATIGLPLPREQFAGRCVFSADNETCDGAHCDFFPDAHRGSEGSDDVQPHRGAGHTSGGDS